MNFFSKLFGNKNAPSKTARAASRASTMTRLRYLGSKARRAATAFAQLITWPWRLFPLLVAPLYPVLKWIALSVLLPPAITLFLAYIAKDFKHPVLKAATEFFADHRSLMFLAMGVVLFLFLVARNGHRREERRRRLGDAFGIYTSAQELSLTDLGFRASHPQEPERRETHAEERPFFGTYFPRKAVEDRESTDADADMVREFAEEELEQLIRDGRGFLLLDHPYSGKTITLFQILRRMTGYTVVSPDNSQRVPDEEIFDLLKGQKVVILLDNIAALARSDYDLELFVRRTAKATKHRYGVAGTCREGGDFTAIAAGHGNHVTYFCEGLPKLRLRPMTNAQRVELAATAGIVLDPKDARNYPLPGNITMRDRTRAMAERFRALDESSKDALRAMKLLDTGGVPLTVPRLQTVLLDVFRRSLEQHPTEGILRNLWDEFFLLEQPSTGRVHPHFGHLVYAVSYQEGPEPEEGRWDNLAQALERARDVEALLHLSHGHRHRGDLVRNLQILDGVLRINPEHADAHFHRGYTLARLGKFEEALKANKQALELRPDFAEAYNNLGYILSRRGELSGALDALQRALELRPDFDDAHTNRAIVLARLGRFQESQQEFSTALGIRPENYYAYLNLGITLSRQGAFNEALIAYEQALKLRPDYPEAHVNRGITLARMERYGEALEAHKQAIKLRPEYVQAHIHLGQTLANMRRYPEAVQALNRAIELQRDYALAYVNRARTFAHMGTEHREEAFRDWQTASALGTVPEQRDLVLAVSLSRMERFDDALAIFDRAIELRPDHAEAHMKRGQTLSRMERFDDALADFTRAIELRSDYAEAHMNRGIALSHMERFDDALADFTRALELRPDNAKAHYERGRTFALLGRYDAALPAFDRAIELRPDYPEAHCDRGSTLANLGRHAEALQAVDIALGHRPVFAEAYFARGFVLTTIEGFNRGRLVQALHAYEEAVRLRPDYPEAHRERGFILGQLGLDEEALAAFNRAIELRPEYAEALFGKARTLCFLARGNPERFPPKESFDEATALLERAIAIDNSIITRITRDRSAFRELRSDPDYGPRLTALVWEIGH